MGKTGRKLKTKPGRQDRRPPRAVAPVRPAHRKTALARPTLDPSALTTDGSVPAQAARLGGKELHDTQRRALASHIGRTQGNRHLQRVVASLAPAQAAAASSAVYRQEEEAQDDPWGTRIAGPVTIKIAMSPPAENQSSVTVDTYADLIVAYRELLDVMFLNTASLIPDKNDNEYWDLWEEHRTDASNYNEYFAQDVPQSDRPFKGQVDDLKRLIRDVKQTGQWAHQSFVNRDTAFKEELDKAQDELERAKKETRQLLRMQFLGGEEQDATISGEQWSLLDKLVSFGSIVADAMSDSYNVSLTVGKLIPGAASLANVAYNWAETTPAMYGTAFEGLADLNNVISLGGAAHGLLGSPFTIVSEYIGPMLSAITTNLGKLQMRMIDQNDKWTDQFGAPVYAAEPGGDKMWNYMVRTMRAPSAKDVPRPSGEVYEYFDEFRERLNTFTSSIIPTEGMVIQEIDATNFMTWLYNHRDRVWIMLYGNRDPKKAKMM